MSVGQWTLIYLALVNLVGGFALVADKIAAVRHQRRVPEIRLHMLELFGAIPIMLLLMYLIRHKNRKTSYFLISWTIMALWSVIIIFSIQYFNS